MPKFFSRSAVFIFATKFSFAVFAQALPDASVLYPDLQQPRLTPPAVSPEFKLEGSKLDSVQPGGSSFELKGMRFSGNTVFSDAELLAEVQERISKQTDFAGLQEIANQLSNFYRAKGYGFARVYLPRQDIRDGVVELMVSEGRYGDVKAIVEGQGGKQDSSEAQAYLSSLQSGETIHSQGLERIALIMNDIPGYTAVPIVRPGRQTGTGDLELRLIEDAQSLQGSVGVDNHGSRYTGEYRARLDLQRSRNFLFGDSVRFTGLTTDKGTGMLYGAYAFPLMPNGLRLELSALYSAYDLHGTGLDGLQGDAQIYGAMLSYPLVRTQTFNLQLNTGLQHKRYVNEGGLEEEYAINVLPLTLNFDYRDRLNGGGLTYGALSYTAAHVVSDNSDFASREKNFDKFNLDIARIQRLTDNLQANIKLSGQHTRDAIDATEFMSLSGQSGVRAFPVGEFSGHRAWTAQTEVSYQLPQWNTTPYVFYDYGKAVNTTTTLRRELSGYGIGLKYTRAGYMMDLLAAWPEDGLPSQVDVSEHGARFWFTLSKRF